MFVIYFIKVTFKHRLVFHIDNVIPALLVPVNTPI